MPAIKQYIVTEVREVMVTALSAIDAARIAAKAFAEGQDANGKLVDREGLGDVWGDTKRGVRQVDLRVEHDRG